MNQDTKNMKESQVNHNCNSEHSCHGHDHDHQHGNSCGHQAVKHQDHLDYLVDGHLHHVHGDHCDSHGQREAA